MTERTCYEILECPPNISPKDLRRAYLRLSLRYHPDKNPSDASAAQQRFVEIGQAYDVLKDPHKRAAYDRELARGNANIWQKRQNREEGKNYKGYKDMFDSHLASMSPEDLAKVEGAVALVGGMIGSFVGARMSKGGGKLGEVAGSMMGGVMGSKVATSAVKAVHEQSVDRVKYEEQKQSVGGSQTVPPLQQDPLYNTFMKHFNAQGGTPSIGMGAGAGAVGAGLNGMFQGQGQQQGQSNGGQGGGFWNGMFGQQQQGQNNSGQGGAGWSGMFQGQQQGQSNGGQGGGFLNGLFQGQQQQGRPNPAQGGTNGNGMSQGQQQGRPNAGQGGMGNAGASWEQCWNKNPQQQQQQQTNPDPIASTIDGLKQVFGAFAGPASASSGASRPGASPAYRSASAPPTATQRPNMSGNGGAYRGSVPHSNAMGRLPNGSIVRVSGLDSRPELNERSGTVVGYDLKTGRYIVQVHADAGGENYTFGFQPENVSPIIT